MIWIELMWLAVVIVVVVVGGVALRQSHRSRALAEWGGAASKFGLTPDHGARRTPAIFAPPRVPRSFSGQYAGFDVRVARRNGAINVDIKGSSDAPRGIAASVGFRRKDESDFDRPPNGWELVMGDPAFDSVVSARGPQPLLRALADAPTRAKIQQLFYAAWQADVALGCLSYKTPCQDVSALIEQRLRDGIELAKALRVKRAQVPRRLAANARGSDLASIRSAALEALAALPDAQECARETTIALLDDPDPEMRLRAATLLGAAEIDRSLALAERERDPRVRVGLLGQLAKFAGARLRPVIREALRSEQRAVLRAAASAAAATGLTDLALEIAGLLESCLAEAEPETLISLIQALSVLRDPATEPALLRALAHQSQGVQLGVASALGEFGSVVAVAALLKRAKRHLYYETEAALLTAVGRIQRRIGIAKAGALSLAGHDEDIGALSLAERSDEVGALSLLGDSTKLDAARR